jgi:hypothetical protein
MIRGTQWAEVKIWHDEDEPTIYRIKVYYEHDYGHTDEGRYIAGDKTIEVLEYPEGATDELKKMIDYQLPDVLEEILSDTDDDNYDIDLDDRFDY